MSALDLTSKSRDALNEGSDQSAALRSLTEIIDALRSVAGAGEKVSVRDIVAEVGARSFAPIILVPSMLLVSPLSGILGLPTIGAIIMFLITVQKLAGRRSVWLPEFILKRQVNSDRFGKALEWLRKPAGWVDARTHKRLTMLVTPPVSRVNLVIILVICLIIPFLEVLPMVTSIFATAITFFAISMLSRDGLFAVLGYVWTSFAMGGIAWLLLG